MFLTLGFYSIVKVGGHLECFKEWLRTVKEHVAVEKHAERKSCRRKRIDCLLLPEGRLEHFLGSNSIAGGGRTSVIDGRREWIGTLNERIAEGSVDCLVA